MEWLREVFYDYCIYVLYRIKEVPELHLFLVITKDLKKVDHGDFLTMKFIKMPISSVIRQKGESQNGCFKKTKHAKFSEKRAFLTP